MPVLTNKVEKQKNTYHIGQGSQSTNISALPFQENKELKKD